MSDARPPAPSPREIAVGDLLSIDVHAELRKLAEAQLEGPWIIPVELVREALSRGAARVDVELGADSVVVRDDGQPIDAPILAAIAGLLGGGSPTEARHAALAALDARGARAWLALAASPLRRVRIVVDDGTQAQILTLEGERPVELRQGPARPGPRGGCVISLEGLDVQPQRARDRLVTACNYAAADLRIDGIAIPRDRVDPHRHPDYLHEAPLSAPFQGRMFVRRDGEGMRARVLVHGVVATTVTLPRAPAVDVAIELAGLLPARATVTDMAARIESLQPLLATQAIALLLRFARSPRGEIPTSRILAIFLAASRHASIPELDALPLVDALDPSGSSTRISLAELRRLSEAQRGVLVLDPSHLDENIATRGIVALLDERTRAALTERFGITFRAPPRKARFAAPSRWRSLGALREWLLGGLADLVWAGARPVPFEALTPAERAAHEILAAAIAGTGGAIRSIVWREGKARCHLREGAWVLSRAHPDVRDFVVAVSADPATLYPRALLLLRGHAMVDARLRADFQARMAHAPH